jgi:hypothetical protein
MHMAGLRRPQGGERSAGGQVMGVEKQAFFAGSESEKVSRMFSPNRVETEGSIVWWGHTRDRTNNRYWW